MGMLCGSEKRYRKGITMTLVLFSSTGINFLETMYLCACVCVSRVDVFVCVCFCKHILSILASCISMGCVKTHLIVVSGRLSVSC